eukprot:scaffold195108_cov20-Tisochrysis_lutea.AAC.1
MKIGGDGSVQFREEEGLDYAATTVKLPGGEYVPFLFTIKEFDGKGTLDSFSGDFLVPSYRGSTFLDPKVCGHCAWACMYALKGLACARVYQQDNEGIYQEWVYFA